ncbi:MAG TPA: hypothetical protein DCY52_05185 [Methylococcaceae bacterium]|jgi:hypothetical protein|nr:hypothetical protein [Methylococcaceae bacterium]
MQKQRPLSDEIDRYRIKSAETEKEKLKVLEEALEKAVERARMTYFWITLSVAVFMLTLVQTLKTVGVFAIPEIGFKWSLVTMTLLIVLPWQLRKLRALG